MKDKFMIQSSVKIILSLVFIFGLILSVFQSDFVLLLNNQDGPAVEAPGEVMRLTEENIKEVKKEKVLILSNPENPLSIDLANNVTQTLAYMKKEWEVLPFGDLPEELKTYDSIIVAFSSIDKMEKFPFLLDYVADGGSLFFAIRPDIGTRLNQILGELGIEEVGGYEMTEGVRVNSPILFGAEGMEFRGNFFVNSSLSLTLKPGMDVLLQTGSGIPLLFEHHFEKGKFVFFNGSALGSKNNRGIIAGAMSLTKKHYIYPVLNAKVAFIDDFPAPFPKGYHPFIKEEFQMETDEFFQKVWWRDVQRGAAKYDVVYSSAMIQTYEDNVQPPFSADVRYSQNLMTRYGRDLLKMGGEIGFHGYNHQSLTMNEADIKDLGYHAWKSEADMEESLKALAAFSQKLYPRYVPNMYVPPSNIISREGLTAIKKALPEVDVIASLYLPGRENKTFTQEFAADEDFIHLPRVTSGYIIDDGQYWAMINALNSVGVFSHFIHPDDVLDPARRQNHTYEKMNERYQDYLEYVSENHSWLRAMIASQAAQEIQSYWKTQTYLEETEDGLMIYNDYLTGELTFILRSEDVISSVKNGTYTEIDEHVYAITTDSAEAKVEFRSKR